MLPRAESPELAEPMGPSLRPGLYGPVLLARVIRPRSSGPRGPARRGGQACAATRGDHRSPGRGGAGDQFWLLTARVDGSFYPDYDGYRIIWDNDPSNATNAAAQMLSAHAKAMTAAS